jgi:ribosomal protein S18 acetylase RimI-like enzyme
VRLVRGTQELALAVARRIVSQSNPDVDEAAKRLVANAASHGIDLRLAWATMDTSVRQACVAVPGSGRTAMMFLSEPMRTGDPGGADIADQERRATVEACCASLAKEHAGRVVLAQALPDPQDRWAVRPLAWAGFESVGTLLYMRRVGQASDRKAGLASDPRRVAWPKGIRVLPITAFAEHERDALLIRAMDASYEQTLDCPELCGLRTTQDILASHKASGVFDPSLWWLVLEGSDAGAPALAQVSGCALFSPSPEQRTCELVYLGLAPRARRKGLGKQLLTLALSQAAAIHAGWSMTCAVDQRNVPAVRLYEGLGFRAFARRVALVKRVDGIPSPK